MTLNTDKGYAISEELVYFVHGVLRVVDVEAIYIDLWTLHVLQASDRPGGHHR